MIDLNCLYEKAPHLAPKGFKKVTRRFKSFSIQRDIPDDTNFENPFRFKLLKNLAVYRSNQLGNYKDKIYFCPSKKTVTSFRSSVNSSVLSASRMDEVNSYYSSKLNPSKKFQDKELQKSILADHKDYQKDITGRLKSTMPKFLESNKKKALRNISSRG